MTTPEVYLGIDIASAKDCSVAVIDRRGIARRTLWAEPALEPLLSAIADTEQQLGPAAIGIDAPRMPLKSPRASYWRGETKGWEARRRSERGHGRHCEVVLKAYSVANPQWTPVGGTGKAWLRLGFDLFDALRDREHVYEVFPSASYHLLDGEASPLLTLSFQGWAKSPKDMADAFIAAATVREYLDGKGDAVGGKDGLGTIVIPRPLPAGPAGVLNWPENAV